MPSKWTLDALKPGTTAETASMDTMLTPVWDGSDFVFLREDSFIAGDLDRPELADD